MNSKKEKKKDKKKRQEKRKKEKKKRKKKKKQPSSLPSLRERSETPGALDRPALGITGGEPVAQLPYFGFGPHYRLPAFCLLGGDVKNRYVYGAAQTPTRLLGRQMFRTPVCKRTRHLDFPPKLGSNSIFKPQPSRLKRVARASGITWPCDDYDL